MDDNLSDALMLAFGVLVFIIGVSVTMYLFTSFTSTSKVIFNKLERPKNTYSIRLHKDNDIFKFEDKIAKYNTRQVTKSAIIPMLYRYYKEDLTIKIVDKSGNLRQVFDLGLEGEVRRITGLNSKESENLSDYEKEVKKLFGDREKQLFLFGATWIGSGDPSKGEHNEDTRLRVDLFVNGLKSSINGFEIDYSVFGRDWFASLPETTTFTENVIKYHMTGDVLINESGNFGEDLVNSSSPNDKIEIIYKEM